jgi:3'-phosphoadenosine 5'-phosphosulfate sulfotransferase (PAPS reductase)/FAD synthetase
MMERKENIELIEIVEIELFESEEAQKHPDREKKKILHIFIKTIDERLPFRVREHELIKRLKIHAMHRFGLDVSQAAQYFFLFQGRRLDESKTIEQENIPNKAELFLKNEPAVG